MTYCIRLERALCSDRSHLYFILRLNSQPFHSIMPVLTRSASKRLMSSKEYNYAAWRSSLNISTPRLTSRDFVLVEPTSAITIGYKWVYQNCDDDSFYVPYSETRIHLNSGYSNPHNFYDNIGSCMTCVGEFDGYDRVVEVIVVGPYTKNEKNLTCISTNIWITDKVAYCAQELHMWIPDNVVSGQAAAYNVIPNRALTRKFTTWQSNVKNVECRLEITSSQMGISSQMVVDAPGGVTVGYKWIKVNYDGSFSTPIQNAEIKLTTGYSFDHAKLESVGIHFFDDIKHCLAYVGDFEDGHDCIVQVLICGPYIRCEKTMKCVASKAWVTNNVAYCAEQAYEWIVNKV